MKIKRHHPPRLAFTALALALASSALITGCRKDSREKIDLSNIHTTAAAETMAPETDDSSAESSSEASKAPDAPAGSASTGDKTGQASAAKNISAKINTYTSGKISIEYPSITNMEDQKKAAAIDALLKDNALSVISAFELDGSQDTLAIKCKVLSADRSRITVTYTGSCQRQGGAFPVNLFYSNTIDVGKADNIGFSKFADPYTMAGYVLSDDCEFYNVSPELASELMKYKNDVPIETYTDLFNHADFPIRETFPESFSYEQEGTIFFSIPVPHALGDYAIIKYTPDTK